jgi:hypothetical protein
LRRSPKGLADDETRVAFLPAPLTARAVGTISKQAGLSVPGIQWSVIRKRLLMLTMILEYENQCLSGKEIGAAIGRF